MYITVVTKLINHEIKLFQHVEDARTYVFARCFEHLDNEYCNFGLEYNIDDIVEEANEMVIQAEETPWLATLYTIEEVEVK